MCNVDQTTMTMIEETVDGFVGQGRMFTAYEVSLAVNERRKGQSLPWVRHSEMGGDVHAYMSTYLNGTYQRVQMDVGAPQKAFVYYPQGADPTTYVPMKRFDGAQAPAPQLAPDPSLQNILQSLANANGAPVTATTLAGSSVTVPPMPSIMMGMVASTAPATNGIDTKDPDKFGRVNVPAVLVREAGLKPGDKAFVYEGNHQNKPCLVVSQHATSPSGSPVTEYTVESHYTVKLRPGVIERAGLGKGPYEFSGSSNQIRVTAK